MPSGISANPSRATQRSITRSSTRSQLLRSLVMTRLTVTTLDYFSEKNIDYQLLTLSQVITLTSRPVVKSSMSAPQFQMNLRSRTLSSVPTELFSTKKTLPVNGTNTNTISVEFHQLIIHRYIFCLTGGPMWNVPPVPTFSC